jgi:hypothetical protein
MQQHELISPKGQPVTVACTDTHLAHLIRTGYKLNEGSPKKPSKEGRIADDGTADSTESS